MRKSATPISRRSFARWPVSIDARLEANGSNSDCRIIDISVGGARLSSTLPLDLGTPVIVDLLTYGCFPASVAWTTHDHIGLLFTISPEVVVEAIQAMAIYSDQIETQRDAEKIDAPNPIKSNQGEGTHVSHQSELQPVLEENRDLKATIDQMRERLESAAYDREKLVQSIEATKHESIRMLEQNVSAMREALEEAGFEKSREAENVRAETQDELTQLKATVSALREKLESQGAIYDGKIQEMEQVFADEKSHLKKTILALRTRLEEHAVQDEFVAT